jgi:hypothetical protein
MKKGDRVIFVSNESGYTLGPWNPLKGSEWFCQGTIDNDPVSRSVLVRWDNGEHNYYVKDDLMLDNSLEEELFEI